MSVRPLLTIQDLNVHCRDFHVLRDVSLTVGKNRIVSVVGANAAGKSTLLKTIMGILRSSSGSITFRDEEIGVLETSEIVSRSISLVPQGRRIFGSLTVRENLLMGFYPLRRRTRPEPSLDRVYRLFPMLRDRSAQLAGTLSGGEQQMLAVARALMADPVLLLCDEISLGLSPRMANRVYDGLHEISRAGVAIMLVEQDVRRSLEFSDFVYFLREGRVVLAAQPATISEDLARKAYFGLEGPGGFCEERP